jgi:acyl-CoA synthetase (AMP-forming)/AMP-acid ligase II
MFLDFMFRVWQEDPGADAIIWNDQLYTYAWLRERVQFWEEQLAINETNPGSVVVIEGDFSPDAIALFLALAERACVIVPITPRHANRTKLIETAQAEFRIQVDADDCVSLSRFSSSASHPLYAELRLSGRPGLVLFSSGSTGESKAALHDFIPLLEKFKVRREPLRTISFLLYDHIGGVNTLLHTLANRGCLVTVRDRTPDGVLRTIAKHHVELLPTSPTFLNLVLMSEAYKRHDLGSLRTITYGTEPMPERTLRRLHEILPQVQLKQTYGLSELGIMRAKSKDSTSLWVKIGGEGFATRVVDGILQIKAKSAMLGYLNAPSPFTADGWFDTADAVEVDGEYLRIVGRTSEIINVGGEKVYPVEVENVIQQLDRVSEVTVYGERNPITGNIVCATITPRDKLDESQQKALSVQIKRHCREQLATYKVPVKVNITEKPQHTYRFKKARG